MKRTLFFSLILFLNVLICSAQELSRYKSLDSTNPITFGGEYIVYRGDTITLGPKAFFIDGQLSDKVVANYPFVFNSINQAAEHLTNGTEEAPMTLFIAPYVYWIDDPDDLDIRVPEEGSTPYGLVIKCEWLRFFGLSDRPENVVLACNRGQTIGAKGNFTMFKFNGDGTSAENITFGNYCNVDLKYPLKPALNRKKRATAIVQAQLIHCNGDKIVARNTRFISRLNLNPFVGGKRVLFDRCHFESTDDALCGTAVYLNCTLDFYSSKPFYHTTGTGAAFLNSDIRLFTGGNQYFTKANGQVAVVDTRFTSKSETYLGWRDVPPGNMRNYQYNVTLNNQPILISKNDPKTTVDMTGESVLDAYRLEHDGKVIYNTYNLLQGNDDWDPMGIKKNVLAAEKEQGKKYQKLPVKLQITPSQLSIETNKDTAGLNAKFLRFGNYEAAGEIIKWSVAPKDTALVALKVSEDGKLCQVIPTNKQNESRTIEIRAVTPSGLQAASIVQVHPSILEGPKFTSSPAISLEKNGILKLNYQLDTNFSDHSLVSWYRCTDARGTNPIEVAVSRDTPLREYRLSSGDVGYYMMVSVVPRHIRSHEGKAIAFVLKQPITASDVRSNPKILYTDFRNFPTGNQPEVIPGFWTLWHFKPADQDKNGSITKEGDAWYYGEGKDGAANMEGLLQGRSASMFYTPIEKKYDDMKLSLTVSPFKTAGQGFSIAHLYMDVLIKFDVKTMSGYALRLIRTTKYGDAVDCMLIKYDNGDVVEISKAVTSSSYITPCTITIEMKGEKLLAHMSSPAISQPQTKRPGVVGEVQLEKEVTSNSFGGFGIQYNGGTSAMINKLKTTWE